MKDLPGYFTQEDGNIHIKTRKDIAEQRCILHVFILLALFVCFSLFLVSVKSTGNQLPLSQYLFSALTPLPVLMTVLVKVPVTSTFTKFGIGAHTSTKTLLYWYWNRYQNTVNPPSSPSTGTKTPVRQRLLMLVSCGSCFCQL